MYLITYQSYLVLLCQRVKLVLMKFFLLSLIMMSKLLIPAAQTNLLSISICKVIEHFYVHYSNHIDIIDFDGTQGHLINEVIKNTQSSISVKLFKVNSPQKWTKPLQTQSILFFETFESLNNFNNFDLVRIDFLYPLRLLVYCVNLTAAKLSKLTTKLVIPPYYYFIILNQNNQKI